MFHATMPQLAHPPPKKSSWSVLCNCLNTRVLKFFARPKIVISFQWISNSETIWIDRTEAEKYLSASRQKRTIEIYLYKTFTNKYLLAVKIQWFRKCKDWEFSFGLSFNYCAEILSIPASWYRHSASHCWIFATFWHLVAITNCTLQCWSCCGVWRRGVQSLIDSSIDGTDNCWVQCKAYRLHLESGISQEIFKIHCGEPWKARVLMYVNLLNIKTKNMCYRLRNLTDKYNSVDRSYVPADCWMWRSYPDTEHYSLPQYCRSSLYI